MSDVPDGTKYVRSHRLCPRSAGVTGQRGLGQEGGKEQPGAGDSSPRKLSRKSNRLQWWAALSRSGNGEMPSVPSEAEQTGPDGPREAAALHLLAGRVASDKSGALSPVAYTRIPDLPWKEGPLRSS